MAQTVIPPIPIFGTTRADSEAKKFFQALTRSPIVWGNLVTASLTTAQSEVRHGLGRVPEGYIVVESTASAIVHNAVASTATTLYLTASATTSVKLWVF
jgi:hypothetical protein